MKDSTIIHELKLVHKRFEQMTMANNMLTKAYSEMQVRIRAYENLIHRGRILKHILPLREINAEVERIKREDITLQEQIQRAQLIEIQQEVKKQELLKEDGKAKKLMKQKMKQVDKMEKSAS